jgi:hypothetical protein
MKRLLFKLCVFLLLGAVVNVAVAWGCSLMAARSVRESLYFVSTDRSPSPYWACSGRVDHFWGGSRFDIWLQYDHMGGSDPEQRFEEWLPAWTYFCAPVDQYDEWGMRTVQDCGWPALAVWGGIDADGQSFAAFHWPSTPARRMREITSVTMLPLYPIWFGFAANTLFYAMILRLIFTPSFALRRHLRRRRNLCPHCAYPIGTNDVCTECGKAVKVREVEATPASATGPVFNQPSCER